MKVLTRRVLDFKDFVGLRLDRRRRKVFFLLIGLLEKKRREREGKANDD